MKHWDITITKKYDQISYSNTEEAKQQFIEDIVNNNFDIDVEEWEEFSNDHLYKLKKEDNDRI